MPKLVDTFNRHINYLRISVTDRCNLRCIYCMPKEGISPIGHDDILRYEEILRVARCAARKGISKIRITGGEPLVRKGIIDFIADLSRASGITDLSITTNGVLLEACAQALYQSGIRRINISLDTLDPEKYRTITRGGDITTVLSGIRKAHEAGFAPIKINVVAMRNVNDDEAVAFARLTIDRPVHIRFIEFMPVAGQTMWQEAQFISSQELQERIGSIGKLLPLDADEKAGPAKMFRLEGAQGKLGFITALSSHFCASCNRLRLTADGKLRTCLFSDDETDLKPLLRGGCTDDELSGVIEQAIRSKPQRHEIHEASYKKCSRTMSAIGG
jgi:GTP 3',8-cyclase